MRSALAAACTAQSHEALKRDARRWATELDPIGEIDAGGGMVVLLANCRLCRSTLAVERERARAPGLPSAG